MVHSADFAIMFMMSRTVLVVLALLLLAGPLGEGDSPACHMSGLVQTTSLDRIDPCPEGDQAAGSNTIHAHTCTCGSLIASGPPLVTAVPALSFTFYMDALWPQTAVTAPRTPPPRTI